MLTSDQIPAEFDAIRPYSPDELPRVLDELIADERFRAVVTQLFPDQAYEALAERMRQMHDSDTFQKVFFYPLLKKLVRDHATSLTLGVDERFDKSRNYTFLSNHRDIVLDSAFLCVLLIEEEMRTVEIAIGDNLLIYPWIKKLVRVNKSFIVQRSVSLRAMLQASTTLSRYIHFAATRKHENIWLAQREGRAKNSDDRTQESVLKMLAMGGEGEPADRLAELNIVPLAISYEYDPCDYLKAEEMQKKRDIEGFKKSPEDDLLNMQTGIFGEKGDIHYQMAPCINPYLETLRAQNLPKPAFYQAVADHIDRAIHTHYRFYPGNFVAYDMLCPPRFQHRYSSEQKYHFLHYLDGQLQKVTYAAKDEKFLLQKMLEMYANPLINHLATPPDVQTVR